MNRVRLEGQEKLEKLREAKLIYMRKDMNLPLGEKDKKAGLSKIARRNIKNRRYANDTTLMAEGEEELKSLLVKVKEESEKADLKLNIQKTKIMTSGPITSWQIDWGESGNSDRFYFGGLKSHC